MVRSLSVLLIAHNVHNKGCRCNSLWYLYHSVYSISMTSETNEIASSVAISRHSGWSLRVPHWSQFYGCLCSREIRWLANGTQLQMHKSPLTLLMDKHQCGAQLRVHGVATIG